MIIAIVLLALLNLWVGVIAFELRAIRQLLIVLEMRGPIYWHGDRYNSDFGPIPKPGDIDRG